MWVLGSELRSSCLFNKHAYLLSHLSSPYLYFFLLSVFTSILRQDLTIIYSLELASNLQSSCLVFLVLGL